MDARLVLTTLTKCVITRAEIYLPIRDFARFLSKNDRSFLLSETSFQKPEPFISFELDRVSHSAPEALSKMHPVERHKLVETARIRAGHDERALILVLRAAMTKE